MPYTLHTLVIQFLPLSVLCPEVSYGLPNNAKQGVLICKIVTDINEPYYNHGYGYHNRNTSN